MRIRIEIDHDLMSRARQAMKPAGDEAVAEAGLHLLIRAREQRDILHLAGKIT